MPQGAHLWLALRIFAACALADAATWMLGLHEGFWAIITAVVVMQPAFGDTLQAGRNRILGTLIGAAAGLLVLEAASRGLPTDILFWIALAPLAVLTATWPNLRLACVTLAVVVLVPWTGDALERPLGRIAEILVGTCASILVSAIALAVHRRRT